MRIRGISSTVSHSYEGTKASLLQQPAPAGIGGREGQFGKQKGCCEPSEMVLHPWDATQQSTGLWVWDNLCDL